MYSAYLNLPKPLSREETKRYLRNLEAGDFVARNVLIERNLRLVAYVAGKFDNTGIDIDDRVSIGTIGLIKAINTFDQSKKTELATYCARCIENEILMYLRKNQKHQNGISLDESLNMDSDGNELILADILGKDPEILEGIIQDEELAELPNILSKFTQREQQLIEMRFGLNGREERTQKEVSELLGISQSYVSRLEKRILKELRAKLCTQKFSAKVVQIYGSSHRVRRDRAAKPRND